MEPVSTSWAAGVHGGTSRSNDFNSRSTTYQPYYNAAFSSHSILPLSFTFPAFTCLPVVAGILSIDLPSENEKKKKWLLCQLGSCSSRTSCWSLYLAAAAGGSDTYLFAMVVVVDLSLIPLPLNQTGRVGGCKPT